MVVHLYPPLVLIGPPVRSTDPWNTSQITHAHRFNGPLSETTRVRRYQKGKTNLDFTEARDSEWQWHQLGHMQVCTSLQTDNHTSNPPLSFLQAGCPSCRPTNRVKALKANYSDVYPVLTLLSSQLIFQTHLFIYYKIVHEVHDRQTYSKNNGSSKSSTKHKH